MPEPDISGNVSETEEILIEEEAETTSEPIALPDLDEGHGRNKWKLLDEAGDGSAPASVKADEAGSSGQKETPEVQNIAEISEADVGNESETEGGVSLEELPVPAVPEEEMDIAVLPAESDEDGTADEKTPLFAEEGKEVRDDTVALPEMQVSQETETVALPAFDDLVDAEDKDNISLSEADETMEQQLLAKLNAETKALLETPVDALISGGTVAQKTEEPANIAIEDAIGQKAEKTGEEKVLQEPADSVVAGVSEPVISETVEAVTVSEQKTGFAVPDAEPATEPKGGKDEGVRKTEIAAGTSVKTPVPVEEKTSGVKAEKVEKSAVVVKKEARPEKTVKAPAVQKKTAKKTSKPAVKARKSVKTAKAKASSGKPAAKIASKAPETVKPAKAAVLPAQKSAVKKTETVQKRKTDKTTTDKTVKIVPPIEMFETEVADVPPAPPEPANKDELDITRETITEGFSPVTGEKETYIFIERWRNPKRFKKRTSVQKSMESGGLDKKRATIQKELQNLY